MPTRPPVSLLRRLVFPARVEGALSPGLKQELWALVGLSVTALVMGRLTHRYLLTALPLLTVYSGWHLVQAARLVKRLIGHRYLGAIHPLGVWGDIYKAIGELQDRSRKRKQGLTRFANRFREAAGALPDAVIIVNKHLSIQWANPAAARLLGISWPQMEQHLLPKAIGHPALEEYLRSDDFDKPLEFSPPANRALVLSLRVTPYGRKQQLLVLARNITQLYQINQVRRDFVSNVSHELRTPLTVLRGFLETMSSADDLPPGQARALELMQRQTGRMQAIVSDLLALSRLEMETDTSGWEPVPVARLLSSVVEEAQALSGDSHHRIHLQANPALPLNGDRSELRSAFSNLIFNAVLHTPPRSEIYIRWYTDGGKLRLSVADTGEGIPARHLSRLTERFYRVDRARSRQSGGTGLGLAIVKHVVQRHGGELRISSVEGKGSVFECEFPAPSAAAGREG